VRYYRLSVGANETIRVIADPVGFDASLRVLDACNATVCIDSVDDYRAGERETIWVRNASGAPREYVVAVSASDPDSQGTFALTFGRAPYHENALSAACDSMTSATLVLDRPADDEASLVAPLPIAFRFFGDAATHYAVTSNGLLQLFPGGGGAASTYGLNDVIPDAAAPNGYVAPFWDDLEPMSTAVSQVSGRVVGTGVDRHYTIQWANFRTIGTETGERMTFQAKLFESTGVIEFHYCSLLSGMSSGSMARVSGSSATIGLENFAGNDGVVHSYNASGGDAVGTGRAIQFVPTP
jgi:hypothetical protein